MTNQELKTAQWEKLKAKFSNLENYCIIEVMGLDDDNIYYHPTFRLDETASITSQADIGNNNCIYAFRLNISDPEQFSVEISDTLLDSVVVGYHTNKDAVMTALPTLVKVRNHISKLQSYTEEYVSNILIGDSLNELTGSFINELKATNQLVSFMRNKSN